MLVLRPQDVVVVLKIAASSGDPAWTYASLASSLGMSASGVHDSVRRATRAGLLSPDGRRPIQAAITEFLVHGLRYAFPPERGRVARGVPTAASAPVLSGLLIPRAEQPLVWPHALGTVRGESLKPLLANLPTAAEHDPRLYALVAVADALRVGSPREREVAADTLRKLLAPAS